MIRALRMTDTTSHPFLSRVMKFPFSPFRRALAVLPASRAPPLTRGGPPVGEVISGPCLDKSNKAPLPRQLRLAPPW